MFLQGFGVAEVEVSAKQDRKKAGILTGNLYVVSE